MTRRLLDLLADLGRRLREGRDERRAARKRAHFWAEVREGEHEAEAQVRSTPGTAAGRSRVEASNQA